MTTKKSDEAREIEKLRADATRRILALEERVATLEGQVSVCLQGFNKLMEARIEDVAGLINSLDKPKA